MASRGSTGSGLLITLVIVSVLSLGFFITTVVFYGQASRAQKDLQASLDASREFLGGQTDLPWAAHWQEQARAARQPVIAYMNSAWEEAMRRTAGDARISLAEFQSNLESIEGATTASLVQVAQQRANRIATLEKQVADANAAAAAAAADLQAEVERVRRLDANHSSTVAALNEEVGLYKGELDRFRTLVDETIAANNARVDTIRRESAGREAGLQSDIARIENENLRLAGQLNALRETQVRSTLGAMNESALVDGRIIGSNSAENSVFIDLGQRDRVALGMSFEIYSNAAAIRPDADGNYPPGKATIEVIRINDGSSVARVVRSTRGNPLVDGDVLANAVYDPSKIYHFVVFGNFDTNGDGVSRAEEQTTIKAIISQWGGVISDDITGRTDFVVLGERPILPPEPPVDAPSPVILEFIRQSQIVDEYDRLFNTAVQASIPVLNQNRLMTLTGQHAIR